MRYQGRITTWKDDRGFGFITPDAGGEPVFVHISGFRSRGRRPAGNEVVTYEVITNGSGKNEARAVAFAGERRSAPARNRPARSPAPILFALAFLGFLGFATLDGWLSPAVPGFYLAASLVAFLAYGFDKGAAERNTWRTKESTLHLFGLIGGWPGALAAQRYFSHKSSKSSFQTMFWTTVVLNCAGLGWLMSPPGAEWIQSTLGWL